MKQTCPKCKTIVEIDETICREGATIDVDCPVCGEQLQFYIPVRVVEVCPPPQEETPVVVETMVDNDWEVDDEFADDEETFDVAEEDYIDDDDLDIVYDDEESTESTDSGYVQKKINPSVAPSTYSDHSWIFWLIGILALIWIFSME